MDSRTFGVIAANHGTHLSFSVLFDQILLRDMNDEKAPFVGNCEGEALTTITG